MLLTFATKDLDYNHVLGVAMITGVTPPKYVPQPTNASKLSESEFTEFYNYQNEDMLRSNSYSVNSDSYNCQCI